MNASWFSVQSAGSRFRPVAWQGWALLVGYIVLLTKAFVYFDAQAHSARGALLVFVPFALLCTFILALAVALTAERPRPVRAIRSKPRRAGTPQRRHSAKPRR